MSNVNAHRVAKNTLLLFFRTMLIMTVGLYSSRVILITLGVEDFGLYNVVAGTVLLFSFLKGTMATSTQRFFSFELGRKNVSLLRQIFSTTVIIHLGISFIVLLFAETFGLWIVRHKLVIPVERAETAIWVYQCSVASFCVAIIQVPYIASIMAHEKMDAYAYVSIFEASLKLSVAFMLPLFQYDRLKMYGILILSVTIIIALLYRGYCFFNIKYCRFVWTFDTGKFREILSFSGWNICAHLAQTLAVYGTNILLNIFFGPVTNAARAVVVQVSGTVQQFMGNFQSAVAPQITKAYASSEVMQERLLILRSCKFSFFLILYIIVPLWLEVEVIVKLWLHTVPQNTIIYLRIVLVELLISSSANPMYHAIMATGHIKYYQIICSSIVALSFAINYVLLRIGFPAASVFFVAIGVQLFLLTQRLLFLRNHIGFATGLYVKRVIFPCSIVCGVSAAITSGVSLMIVQPFYFALIAVCIVSFSVTSGMIWLFGVTSDERFFIKGKIKTLSSKMIQGFGS